MGLKQYKALKKGKAVINVKYKKKTYKVKVLVKSKKNKSIIPAKEIEQVLSHLQQKTL